MMTQQDRFLLTQLNLWLEHYREAESQEDKDYIKERMTKTISMLGES